MSINTGHEEDLKPQEGEEGYDDEGNQNPKPSVEELQEKLRLEEEKRKKAEEYAQNQKIRAEKAERGDKKPIKAETKSETLSTADLLAITKANLHEDDLDEVLEYARFKKIPIREALNSSVVKATLSEKEEFRKTAEMANTTNARKGVQRQSPQVLVEKLKQGEVPQSKEEAEELFWARNGGRRK